MVPNWAKKIGDLLAMIKDPNNADRHKYQEYNKKPFQSRSSKLETEGSWGHVGVENEQARYLANMASCLHIWNSARDKD